MSLLSRIFNSRCSVDNKLLSKVELTGEAIVVLASALWITGLRFVSFAFCAGVLMLAVGRLAQKRTVATLTLQRLYRQRNHSVFFLFLASALMFVDGPFRVFDTFYVFKSSWLMLFIIFVVIEVYTTFRISHLESKLQ